MTHHLHDPQVGDRAGLASRSEPVCVIGAGLGGLTAALALLRDGRSVRVFEQAPVLGEVGAGITLSPGAGRGLASLGVGPELLAASTPIPDIAFVHYATGKLLTGRLQSRPPADLGFASPRHIHRADLHAILLAGVRAIDPNAVVAARRLVRVVSDADGVKAGFSVGSEFAAGLLIGADGTRSTVRRLLFDDSPPRFASQIAFRCLIPRDVAAPHLSAGGAAVYVGPSRIFNRYLIRRGALLNVIGIAKCDLWRDEGWNTTAASGEFLDIFADFHVDVRGLIALAPPASLIKWGLFIRPPLDVWSRGRVALIGDAAHPILPFLGLGAALAIEDGVVVARALAQAPSPHEAFAAFQRARWDRVEAVRQASIRQGDILQTGEPDRPALAASPSQNAALFDYDPCTVPLDV
jgi:salicylate hydroxylase